MPQIIVKDASGNNQTVETLPPLGRAAAASSRPAALSNEDLAVLNNILTAAQAPTPAGTNLIGYTTDQDVRITGASLNATANSTYRINLAGGRSAVGLAISGLTASGATLTVERSNDNGTTWTSANTTEGNATSSLSSTLTTDGQARVGTAGATDIRLRVTTAGTGTITVSYSATSAPGPMFMISRLPYYAGGDPGIIGAVGGLTPAGVSKGLGLDTNGNLFVIAANLVPTAGTNLGGTVTTTSGGFNLPANTARRPGDVQGQNTGANPIAFNEFGGTAVIGGTTANPTGDANSYVVPPQGTFSISTTNLVNFVALTGSSTVAITRIS